MLKDAVRVTLGLRSKCRLIQKKFGRPLVCNGGVVVSQVRASQGSHGFDAATGKYVNLFESDIIDPTKVVRMALENAVSVVGILLLTDATLTDLPEPKSHEHHAAMPEE